MEGPRSEIKKSFPRVLASLEEASEILVEEMHKEGCDAPAKCDLARALAAVAEAWLSF